MCHRAALRGDLLGVQSFIDGGGNADQKDKNGRTAVHSCCRGGSVQVLELLLKAGASPSVAESTTGYTPLIYCSSWNRPEMAQILLDASANIDAQDCHGKTSLIWACQEGNIDVVHLLLQHKADFSLRTIGHQTALHVAYARGQFSIAKALLEAGADAKAVDFKSRSPQMLLARGSMPNTSIGPTDLQAGVDSRRLSAPAKMFRQNVKAADSAFTQTSPPGPTLVSSISMEEIAAAAASVASRRAQKAEARALSLRGKLIAEREKTSALKEELALLSQQKRVITNMSPPAHSAVAEASQVYRPLMLMESTPHPHNTESLDPQLSTASECETRLPSPLTCIRAAAGGFKQQDHDAMLTPDVLTLPSSQNRWPEERNTIRAASQSRKPLLRCADTAEAACETDIINNVELEQAGVQTHASEDIKVVAALREVNSSIKTLHWILAFIAIVFALGAVASGVAWKRDISKLEKNLLKNRPACVMTRDGERFGGSLRYLGD